MKINKLLLAFSFSTMLGASVVTPIIAQADSSQGSWATGWGYGGFKHKLPNILRGHWRNGNAKIVIEKNYAGYKYLKTNKPYYHKGNWHYINKPVEEMRIGKTEYVVKYGTGKYSQFYTIALSGHNKIEISNGSVGLGVFH